MEVFLLKTTRRLRKEAPRRCKELRTLADDLINILTEKENNNTINNDNDADKHFELFQMSCDSRHPRVMEIALDGIHYLIEHGYLKGHTPIEDNVVEADNVEKSSSNRILMDLITETVSKCSDEYDDGVQLQVIKALLTAITSTHCEVHEASLLLAIRACFHIHLITKNQINKTTAKAALTQMLSVINQRMEQEDLKMRSTSVSDNTNNESETSVNLESIQEEESNSIDITNAQVETNTNEMIFPSILHKDTFLIFRALCKLSQKGLQDDTGTQGDPIALQNKMLSLELILHVLQHSGPAFRNGERFIFAVRNYLCVSLLRNCTSPITQVTGLSLQIFVALMEGFKDHLKGELEVFVTNIFLRILESENSTFDHKLRVLEVFHNICKDPSAQVELFINYDCDFEAIDLFRRIVDGFAKVAKNPSLQTIKSSVDFISSAGKRALMEEHTIRMKGLEGLVIVLKSLLSSAGLKSSEDDISLTNSQTDLRKINDGRDSPVRTADDDNDPNIVSSPIPMLGETDIVDVFDRKQKIQEEIETGILQFNLNTKKGLKYLADRGHLEMTPKAVADFFKQYADRLDKTSIGDYLGREREYENGFCLHVLHEYADSMDFAGMAFDIAIRTFLSGFRLPGEAQKIDRIMEKFAEKYYLQNRDVFASADMAFILAFSTIMLQTNLHNPAIRDDKRMTKADFIKQNKGISSDGEIPEDMLLEIYERIAAQPISITGDDKFKKQKKDESFVVFQTSSDRKRKDAFNNERKEMVRASEAMFRQKTKRGTVFVRNSSRSDEAYVRPMFEVVWAPITGVISQILETYEDPVMVELCLTGFRYAIRLACRLDFPTARHTFINALAKFTTLDTIREMHIKNVDCIKLLLDIALTEGDYLEDSWSQILQCISQLARLQLFANGLHTDDMFFSDTASVSSAEGSKRGRSSLSSLSKDKSSMGINMDQFSKLFSGPSKAETARLVEEANAEMVSSEIDHILIDRIFSISQVLSSESVYHFVKSLCEVSMLEITASSSMNSLRGKEISVDMLTPRVFSLQKLVEVADLNMHLRSRISWGQIWGLLAEHFTTVGVNDNHALAMFAVDSLKQLSMKFLMKEELSNFNFQRVFLKPFEIIVARSKSAEIKHLVLICISIMIKACVTNIRSGWRTIFTIFEVAASQDVLEISSVAFDITEKLMTEQFELLIYDFVELMNCLVAFVAGAHNSISLKALNHLAICADHLAEGAIAPALDGHDSQGVAWGNSKAAVAQIEIGQDASVFRLWWPLLLGLSARVSDNREQVRTRALKTLVDVLRKYGNLFSAQTWAVIFKGVLFPMIDSAKTDSTQQPESSWPAENPPPSTNKQSWIGTMGQTVLSACLELYQMFKEKSESVSLLPDMMTMLESCVCQDTESLARMGLNTLDELIISLKISDECALPRATIDLVCSRLTTCLYKNLCLDFPDAGHITFDSRSPSYVLDNVRECPLSMRKRSKEDNNNREGVGAILKTAYGQGSVNKVLPPNMALMVPARKSIILDWGVLYSQEKWPPAEPQTSSGLSPNAPRLSTEQAWKRFSVSCMTSMVVTLDSIRIIDNIIKTHSNSLQLDHYTSLLTALETSYHHAYSFNCNSNLRSNLRSMNFMSFHDNPTKLPHLLDQEVISLTKILSLVLRLYLKTDDKTYALARSIDSNQLETFAEPWLQKIMIIVLEGYIEIDALNPSNYSKQSFVVNRHEAYIPVVSIALSGVVQFRSEQFRRSVKWLMPLLSKLIVCSDKDIRVIVSNIFTFHITPLLK